MRNIKRKKTIKGSYKDPKIGDVIRPIKNRIYSNGIPLWNLSKLKIIL